VSFILHEVGLGLFIIASTLSLLLLIVKLSVKNLKPPLSYGYVLLSVSRSNGKHQLRSSNLRN